MFGKLNEACELWVIASNIFDAARTRFLVMAGQSADISATRLSASGQTLLFARNAGNFATGLGQCEISHRVLDVEVTRARLAALAYGGWHSLARCRNVPQHARLDREWYLRPFPHRAIKA